MIEIILVGICAFGAALIVSLVWIHFLDKEINQDERHNIFTGKDYDTRR